MAEMMVMSVPDEVCAKLREVALYTDTSYSELVARALQYGAGSATSWARGQALARTIAATRTSNNQEAL